MFQFPGFALKTLCIQVINTWFTSLLIAESNNNKVSSGLPHSEIHGSKLILSSPWLIAEYYVLHRLLLPRHPPNALLALDLIQKKSDFFRLRSRHFEILVMLACASTTSLNSCHRIRGGAHSQMPAEADKLMIRRSSWLVYLTWKDCKSLHNRLPTHALEGIAASHFQSDWSSQRS